MSKYQAIIGMEVHVELKTKSKMFCSCPNLSGFLSPNVNICEICLAHPGTLPVPNKQAIIWSVLIGKALGCQIRSLSKFDRKHYFYPDLPKGYQISQYDEPIAENGKIALQFFLDENPRSEALIGITRAHLEEDTAKLVHDSEGNTLADFNRAGTPLVEIVTDPDFQTSIEAKTYCQELQLILRTLGVSDADMEHGQMRCEANISVQEADKFEIVGGVVKAHPGYKLNNKVELKNLNSFRSVEKSLEFEINRQTALLENGELWPQETRGWDDEREESYSQRIKENAKDYRYFPEPDISPFSPILISGEIFLPELPAQKRLRFHEEYGFAYADAKFLSEDKLWANFVEQVMSELSMWILDWSGKQGLGEDVLAHKKLQIARLASAWMINKLQAILNQKNITLADMKLSAENFAEFISLVFLEKINSTNAQKLLLDMLESNVDADPTHIMDEKGYGKISDLGQLGIIIDGVISEYPLQVEQFRAGKDPVIKFLIGMVMKASQGSGDPILIEELLRKKL
jgi:aspartyl-tRNA(Asn)/glutamyl-tRNA(Gln) amidotransferase subunit B